MNKSFLGFFLIVLASFNSGAQTIETNLAGFVIKNYKCSLDRYVAGDLVNRTSAMFTGRIRVKIIDAENDILWQGTKNIKLEGQNGLNFFIESQVGTCLAPNKVQITLER